MSYDEVKEDVKTNLNAVEGMVKNLIASKKEAESKEIAQSTALTEINQRLEEMNTELNTLKTENEKLKQSQQQNDEINQEIKEKDETIKRLTNEKEACEEKIKQIQEMLKMSQEESSGKTLVLEEENTKLQARIDEIDAEMNRLNEQNKALKSQLDKCQSDMKAVDDKLRDILKLGQGEGIEDIEQIIKKKEEKLLSLSNENTKLQGLNDILKKTNVELQKTIRVKNAANEMAKQITEEALTTGTATQSSILKQQQEEYKNKITELEQQILANEKQIEDKESEITARMEEANKAKDDALAEANEQIKAAKEAKVAADEALTEANKAKLEAEEESKLLKDAELQRQKDLKRQEELKRQEAEAAAKKADDDAKAAAAQKAAQEAEAKKAEDDAKAAYNEIDEQLEGIAGELGKIKEDKTSSIDTKLKKIEDLQETFSKIDVGKISQLPEDGEFNKNRLLEKKDELEKAINKKKEEAERIAKEEAEKNSLNKSLDDKIDELKGLNGKEWDILNTAFEEINFDENKTYDDSKKEEYNKQLILYKENLNNYQKLNETYEKLYGEASGYNQFEERVNDLLSKNENLDNQLKNKEINYDNFMKRFNDLIHEDDSIKKDLSDKNIDGKSIVNIEAIELLKKPKHPNYINNSWLALSNKIKNIKDKYINFFSEILREIPAMMDEGKLNRVKVFYQLLSNIDDENIINLKPSDIKEKDKEKSKIWKDNIVKAKKVAAKLDKLANDTDSIYSYDDGILSENEEEIDSDKIKQLQEKIKNMGENDNETKEVLNKFLQRTGRTISSKKYDEMLKEYENYIKEREENYKKNLGLYDLKSIPRILDATDNRKVLVTKNEKKIIGVLTSISPGGYKVTIPSNPKGQEQKYETDYELLEAIKSGTIKYIVDDDGLEQLQEKIIEEDSTLKNIEENIGNDDKSSNTQQSPRPTMDGLEKDISLTDNDKKEIRNKFDTLKIQREKLKKHISDVVKKRIYGTKFIYVIYDYTNSVASYKNGEFYLIQFNSNKIEKTLIHKFVTENIDGISKEIVDVNGNGAEIKQGQKLKEFKNYGILKELLKKYRDNNKRKSQIKVNEYYKNDEINDLPEINKIKGQYIENTNEIHVIYLIDSTDKPHLISNYNNNEDEKNRYTTYIERGGSQNYIIKYIKDDKYYLKYHKSDNATNNDNIIYRIFMSQERRGTYSIDTGRAGQARNSVLINKIVGDKSTDQIPERAKNLSNSNKASLTINVNQEKNSSRRGKNSKGGENKISQDSMGSLSRKVHKGRRGGYRYSDLGMKGISIDFGELRKKQRKTLKAKKKKLSKQKKAKKHGKGTKRVKRKRVQSRRKK